MASPRVDEQLSPPAFLRLVGHALRWQLLRELARSDRLVSELTRLVAQPQNLVSYHLGKLRDGGLVSARRSSADGRDSFYTVDLAQLRALLAATGAALHPGLGLGLPVGEAAPRPAGATVAVLFLCTGNSARSQMAEALVRARSGGTVDARSAGSRPKALHANAVRAMRERGIDIAGQRPKHLDEFAEARFDRVITLCDRVREVCPDFPGDPEPAHWSIPDPAAGGDDDVTYPAFLATAAELETRVGFLLAALGTAPINGEKETP
jgi:ArsR family transcriptional regulator, arsenate/arsenite/antimonite-responsive transcriptional repressor / arsenate reductase (thioredoxin)